VGKTVVIYGSFLHDVARQKLKSASASRSSSKNDIGTAAQASG